MKKTKGYGFKAMKKKLAVMAIAGLLAVATFGVFAEEAPEEEFTVETMEEVETEEAEIQEEIQVIEEEPAEVEELDMQEAVETVVEETEDNTEITTEEPVEEIQEAPAVDEEELTEVTEEEEIPEETMEGEVAEEETEATEEEFTEITYEEEPVEEVSAEEQEEELVEDVAEEEFDETVEEEIQEEAIPEITEILSEEEPETEENSYDYSSEMVGSARAPYFIVDGEYAFCIEPDNMHPADGTGYNEIEGSKNFDSIFVNAYEMDMDEDTLNKSIQLAIWSTIKGVSYESAAQAFIGTSDVYNALLADVDISNYLISYRFFGTDEIDLAGNFYQTLMSAKVEKIEVPAEPEQPEVPETPEEPETPEIPEKPEVPEVPEVEEPEKQDPIIIEVPVEKITVIEKTVPVVKERVIEKTVETQVEVAPTASEWVINDVYVPQTGDASNLLLYVGLAMLAMLGMAVVLKNN